LAVVREPDGYARARHALAPHRRADGPVSRAVEQIGVVQERVRYPGANAALKLALQARGVGNPLGRARRSAGRLEQADGFRGELTGRAVSDASHGSAIVVVVAQRHAPLKVAHRADGREPVAASERAVAIVPENAAEDAFLFRADPSERPSKSEMLGSRARQPRAIGERRDHDAPLPGVTRPIGVSSRRGVALTNAARNAR